MAGKGRFPCGPDGGIADPSTDSGKDPCAPMDAHTGSLPCISTVGYAWNGKDCVGIACSCEGTECDQIYSTAAGCRSVWAECLARQPVSASCSVGADCLIARRACCGAICDLPGIGELIALNASSWPAWQKSLACALENQCTFCPSQTAVQALCQAGTCTAVDLTPYGECTKDADCTVTRKDCCACDGPVEDPNAYVAVSGSAIDAYTQFACAASTPCDCVPGRFSDRVEARCDVRHSGCFVHWKELPK